LVGDAGSETKSPPVLVVDRLNGTFGALL